MVTLVLDSDKRIVSIHFPDEPNELELENVEEITVDSLPDLSLVNYKYIDGNYIYDPIIMTESEKDSMETSVDHEFRIMMLEIGVDE